MKRFVSVSISVVIFLVLAGCTNQELYEAIQANRIQDCDKYAYESARQECREGFETSYDSYEQDRVTELE